MRHRRRRLNHDSVTGKVLRRMKARLRRLGDGLAGLAGARTDLLEAAPGPRSRFVEQAVVASGGQSDTGLAPVQTGVTTAQATYGAALASYQALDAKAQCELNGTCGTGQPGTGTAYQQAKAAADAQAAVVASAKSSLDAATAAASSARSRSAAEATSNLATDKATLARLTAEQDRLQAAFDVTNSD